jgi:hypothetical protein
MEQVNGRPGVGSIRAFTTNYGPHTPEVIAEMTMSQLVDQDSNPLASAEIRQALVDLYAQTQRTMRVIFKQAVHDAKVHDVDRNMMKTAINQIICRDFATALDVERHYSKE